MNERKEFVSNHPNGNFFQTPDFVDLINLSSGIPYIIHDMKTSLLVKEYDLTELTNAIYTTR